MLSCKSSQQIHETVKIVEVHDTIRMSELNDRHDSVVYIYRNDTVMIDRWHSRLIVDTVYKNNTEYVHDTLKVEQKIGNTKERNWTLQDDLNAFLIGIFMMACIAFGARLGYKINYNR